MRKRLMGLGACLLALFGLCIGVRAAAGGADDPLLSVSYLYNTILPRLQSLFQHETGEGLDALAESYTQRLDALQPPEESIWDRAEGYQPLSLQDGVACAWAPSANS